MAVNPVTRGALFCGGSTKTYWSSPIDFTNIMSSSEDDGIDGPARPWARKMDPCFHFPSTRMSNKIFRDPKRSPPPPITSKDAVSAGVFTFQKWRGSVLPLSSSAFANRTMWNGRCSLGVDADTRTRESFVESQCKEGAASDV